MLRSTLLGLALVGVLAAPSFAAIPSSYSPGPSDTVKIDTPSGSYFDSNFYNSVNAAQCAGTISIASGFGTAPTIIAANGTCSIDITIGTSNGGSGVLTLPAAAHGWHCVATDITTTSTTVAYTKESASTTTSATLQNYSDVAAAHAWVDGDTLLATCDSF